ncbi:UNVERIFIED_CONTAM: hypothetical protein Sradi_6200100 [Sesamum radiatum]|uniref:Retrotransposon Copia-like N-terminal domain-containing protein n=1 Tax=Sesamum radiatum TaxID=300843 RepID=A0AAW2K8P0_SESRA
MATQATEGSAAGQAALVQHGSEVLQLLSSDHPGMVLVSSPLDSKNFLAWSRAVKRVLGAKMKLGFIIGTCKKPSGDPELIEEWTRVDCMVASWLLNAMTKNVSNAFICAKFARTLWVALNEWHGECNGSQLYQLERDIASITQAELNDVTKDNAASVFDVVMELVRALKQITNDLIQDHLTKTVVAVAKQSRHLYILDKDSFNPAFIIQFLSSHFSFASQVVGSDLSLWNHIRLIRSLHMYQV